MAVTIKRYLPYSGNNFKSPFEAIQGRLPTPLEVKSLKTPFATAYCKTDTTNAQKKYKIGIMVGRFDELAKYQDFQILYDQSPVVDKK